MDNILYLYDVKNLTKLRSKFERYEILTLTGISSMCNGNQKELELFPCDDSIVDLTSALADVKDKRWYMGALEEWVLKLKMKFNEVIFIMNSEFEDQFKETYPFIFDEVSTEFLEEKSEIQGEVYQSDEKVDLYTYNDIEDISKLEIEVISISKLMKEDNGINFKLNLESLSSLGEKYIDITPLVESLKFRKDRLMMTEIIFYKLNKLGGIKLLTTQKNQQTLKEVLPFLTSKVIDVGELLKKSKINKHLPLGETVKSISEKIAEHLQGHSKFKEEFKEKLLSFLILNKIKERKIFSILICGKSGIGKTNFATALSEIMYPEENQIKLNFGNYSTEGVLNSLIGSPLGYIGSEEGGELINKVKNSESKVILIDEFEKANESVFNFFYELLEDGKFTDRAGIEHDLNQYIIIFTSNLEKDNYDKVISAPLLSRLDMKVYFELLNTEEKREFIKKQSLRLVEKLSTELEQEVETLTKNINFNELYKFETLDNIREIKRKVDNEILKQLRHLY